MSQRDIVLIGGSAGSTSAINTIVSSLPADSRASVFIVTHTPRAGRSHLVSMLKNRSALPVVEAKEGMPIEPGRIVIAAASRHLILTPEGVRLGSGPMENMARPAIDPLFRSAALAFGGRCMGVVLSGMLRDGAAGLAALKACGGLAIVQDPESADYPSMPRAALQAVEADLVGDPLGIGRRLVEEIGRDVAAGAPCPPAVKLEVEIALGERLGSEQLIKIADPAPLTCPNCNGVLSEVRGSRPKRFRCQTGHGIVADDLAEEQAKRQEEAIRVAMRIIEERVELARRMALDARESGRDTVATLYEDRAIEYGRYAETLRQAALATIEMNDVEGD